MNLREKKYFYFTQNSLSTFVNCPFKFKKKYTDNVKWQEETDDSLVSRVNFGIDFHKIAERYFKRIPVYEEGFKDNEELYNAYENLKEMFPLKENEQYYPEYTIRFSDGDMRLEANIDLVLIKGDGKVEIWDWKTNANINNSKKYEKSLQTSVYMFALKKCSKDIFGTDFACEDINMAYFSPEQNCKIADIPYSDKFYKKDEEVLKSLIEKVYNYNYDMFDRESYSKQCKFCEFNTFCNNQKSTEVNDFGRWDFEKLEEAF